MEMALTLVRTLDAMRLATYIIPCLCTDRNASGWRIQGTPLGGKARREQSYTKMDTGVMVCEGEDGI
jgi:hypothetical protein